MTPRVYAALAAAQAWLEDAEIQLHNSHAILVRAEERGAIDDAELATVAELRVRIEVLTAQTERTLEAVEAALSGGPDRRGDEA